MSCHHHSQCNFDAKGHLLKQLECEGGVIPKALTLAPGPKSLVSSGYLASRRLCLTHNSCSGRDVDMRPILAIVPFHRLSASVQSASGLNNALG